MAYALIAGVDPRFGLYSAIVVTIIASIFGSSSHLINGPTNAISLVVFAALTPFDAAADAYQAMFLLAVIVGTIQILIAVFRLGDLTRYVSESVILGFMAGAGVLVAVGQVGNFLGAAKKGSGDQSPLVQLWETLTKGGPFNLHAIGLGAGNDRGGAAAAPDHQQVPAAADGHAPGASRRRRSGGGSRMVDPGGGRQIARGRGGQSARGAADLPHRANPLGLGLEAAGQRRGDFLSRVAGSVGGRQIHRHLHPAAARLQPAVSRRRHLQSGRRLFPELARLRLADALLHQLPVRRDHADVGHLFRGDRGGGGAAFRTVRALHPEGRAGGPALHHRRAADRLEAARLRAARLALRRRAGAGDRLGGDLHQRR